MDSQEETLEASYPWIPWRDAFKVTNTDTGVKRLACRFCIAMYGLKGSDIDGLFVSVEEHAEHLVVFHHIVPEGEPPDDNG